MADARQRDGPPEGQLPDLLYPGLRLRRIEEMRPCLGRARLVLPDRLHRVTVFATFRCNLACGYCNTIRPATRGGPAARAPDFSLAGFRRLLEDVTSPRMRHIHLTGGEATLVRDLPDMVALAADRGIGVSLTTNGTAAPGLYRELVRRGLREVRVSCDTHDAEQFDRIVGRPGSYGRVVAAIRELVRLREEEGAGVYVIVNMCVGRETMGALAENVERSVALGPDDVKLLSISHERDDLAAFEERHRVLEDVAAGLARFPRGRFPLLRLKLRTVFSLDSFGLDDLPSRMLMSHCFVPLTERTVDSAHYYPCPVYVREGGAALGSLAADDFAAQQRRILEFVRGESCLEDEICRRFCIGCCKKFNLHANAAVNGTVRQPDGSREPVTDRVEWAEAIPRSEVVEAMRAVARERERLRDVPYRPFFVVKPCGMRHRDRILALLGEEGARVARRAAIPDWNAAALRIYAVPLTEERVLKALLLARALPGVEGTAAGEILLLEGDDAPADLARLKAKVRAAFPPRNCLVDYRDELFVISLSYVHSPSEENLRIESNVLLARLEDGGAG